MIAHPRKGAMMANDPDSRISFKEFSGRLRKGGMTRSELRKHVLFDRKRTVGFTPVVSLNPQTIDLAGHELSSEKVLDLLQRWSEPPPAKAGLEAFVAKKGPKLLAEGDSWFKLFGCFGYPKSAMEVLDAGHDILNLAFPGAKLADIVKDKDYKAPLGAGTRKLFFFSAGGNDVLGDLDKHVGPRNPNDTDPANAAGYVKASFTGVLDKIMTRYQTLLDDKREYGGASVQLFVHGYANAIPRKNGKYLGKPLKGLGFDPVTHDKLCKKIIAEMIDRFNLRLAAFAAAADVTYVDLRPVMTANDWHTDEIHPNKTGAAKIAKRLGSEIAPFIPVA